MTVIYQGNSHTGPTIAAVDGNDDPFELASSTVTLTVQDQRGDTLLTHYITLDGLGAVTSSDGMALESTSTAGVVINTLTQGETDTFPVGWVRWFATLTDSNGNTWPLDDGAWEVRSDTQTFTVVRGVTRRDIRRRALTKLGDLLIVRATEAGSISTLIDRIHLSGEPDAYRGREILFTGGTVANRGEQRYVTGSSRTNRSLTMDYDLPAATAEGDEAELINMRGTGYRFSDIEIAIDAAVESASNMAPEHVIWEVSDTYDKDVGTITIPDDWIAISAVDWREASDQPWQALDFHQKRLGSGWTLDRARRLINISGERSLTLHERAVRIYGLRAPQAIPNDDDVTGINAEWLVARVVAELSSAAYRRSPTPERRDMLSYDLENERIIRTRVTKRSGAMRL